MYSVSPAAAGVPAGDSCTPATAVGHYGVAQGLAECEPSLPSPNLSKLLAFEPQQKRGIRNLAFGTVFRTLTLEFRLELQCLEHTETVPVECTNIKRLLSTLRTNSDVP